LNKEMNEKRMSRSDAMRRIEELSFVKAELELFLDTHPDCTAALDYYRKTLDALAGAVAEYEASYGPVRAEGAAAGDGWSWVGGEWPWYSGIEKTTDKRFRGR